MKIIFLASCKADLRWFKHYYMSRFPEGRQNADAQFLKAKELLSNNPHIGHPVEGMAGVRVHSVTRTPFAFIYRVTDDAIQVLRVLDSRAEESNDLI